MSRGRPAGVERERRREFTFPIPVFFAHRGRFEPHRGRIGVVGDAVDGTGGGIAHFVGEAGVEEIPFRAGLEIDARVSAPFGQEGSCGQRIRVAVGFRRHHVDASAHRIAEEDGAFIFFWQGAAAIYIDPGDRRAVFRRAGVARSHPAGVSVEEERLRGRPRFRVERFAER